jgi:hypothetical protein
MKSGATVLKTSERMTTKVGANDLVGIGDAPLVVATPGELMTPDGRTTLYGQPQSSQSPTDSMGFTNVHSRA